MVTSFGVTARNLGYDLDWEAKRQNYNITGNPDGNKTSVALDLDLPQAYVLGLSYRPLENTLFTLDFESYQSDLGDVSRIHFGIEQTLFLKILALRLGAVDNDGDSITATAGIGFKLGPLVLDAAAVFPEDSEDGYYLTAGIKF